MSQDDFRGVVALVTGASRGIGKAVVEALVARGAEVAAVARDHGALEEMARRLGAACVPLACDLSTREGAERARDFVAARWGRLDVMIGNAAIMGRRTEFADLAEEDWGDVLATNVTANWRLIRAFDGFLRAAPAGRAVFMTSGAGSRARMGAARGAYAISKAALDALARTYASETEGTRVRVMLFNPGPIRTGLRAIAAPGEDPMTLRTPEEAAPKILALCSPAWSESGRLYDFPQDRVLDYRGPA